MANFVSYHSPEVLYLAADKKVCEIIWDLRRTQKNRVNTFPYWWLGNVVFTGVLWRTGRH